LNPTATLEVKAALFKIPNLDILHRINIRLFAKEILQGVLSQEHHRQSRSTLNQKIIKSFNTLPWRKNNPLESRKDRISLWETMEIAKKREKSRSTTHLKTSRKP